MLCKKADRAIRLTDPTDKKRQKIPGPARDDLVSMQRTCQGESRDEYHGADSGRMIAVQHKHIRVIETWMVR